MKISTLNFFLNKGIAYSYLSVVTYYEKSIFVYCVVIKKIRYEQEHCET